MSKKKKIVVYSAIGFILLSAIIFVLCCHFLIEKDAKFTGFKFKEVTKINYNAYDLSDFIEGVTCDESCFYNNEELEYFITNIKNLGNQEILIRITYQNNTYEHTYQLEVVDEIAPIITLKEKEISFLKNSDSAIDEESYILEISDNYDELTIDDIEIESKVDLTKVGDYEIIYRVTDSNNNTSSASLIVHVVDSLTENETEEKETAKENNTAKNSNKNNKPSNNQISNNSASSSFK